MSPAEIIRQLESLSLDLGFGDHDLARHRAVREAIAIIEERSAYDWLSAGKARGELDRVRVQLEALGALLGNLSETLGRVTSSVPRGYQRDAVERARQTIDTAFDSIFGVDLYKKGLDQ